MDKPDKGWASSRERETAKKQRLFDETEEEFDEQEELEQEDDDAAVRARTTETINRATSARMAERAVPKRPAAAAKPSTPRRLDKKEAGMIDFKEELLKYKPLLDVDDIEDSIRLDEMSDVMDLLQQLLKSVKNPTGSLDKEY